MKACRHCGETKPLADYYAHSMMADGHLNVCKPCVKAQVKRHREENLDRIREYDRRRSIEHPQRKAALRSKPRRKMTAEQRREYREKAPEKNKARNAVNNALRMGKIAKWPCQRCGTTERVHAHHDDYSRPFDVMWLCPAHHGERHRELNEMRRQKERAA
jgi:hypothetical protein